VEFFTHQNHPSLVELEEELVEVKLVCKFFMMVASLKIKFLLE
ncbi:hypothetical protein HMPREF0548_1320, partial [Lactobacillus ultunensis DSM 16047]